MSCVGTDKAGAAGAGLDVTLGHRRLLSCWAAIIATGSAYNARVPTNSSMALKRLANAAKDERRDDEGYKATNEVAYKGTVGRPRSRFRGLGSPSLLHFEEAAASRLKFVPAFIAPKLSQARFPRGALSGRHRRGRLFQDLINAGNAVSRRSSAQAHRWRSRLAESKGCGPRSALHDSDELTFPSLPGLNRAICVESFTAQLWPAPHEMSQTLKMGNFRERTPKMGSFLTRQDEPFSDP